jgi:hypothetical protein
VNSARADNAVRASQEGWRETRRFLNANRLLLTTTATELYPDVPRIEGTLLLSQPAWLPAAPLELGDVQLRWDAEAALAATSGREPESERVRPFEADGRRYDTYAAAVAALDRPRLFENRRSYRLVGVDLATGRRLTFGDGRYFDVMNVAEAAAHEYAAQVRAGSKPGWNDLPLRSRLGGPFDLGRRPLMVAMSALTLRQDPTTGDARFVLHWRDPQRVATGGGLYQVIPVGVFQPTGEADADRANDFDLWRGLVREYSEEFLGAAERTGDTGGVLDYDAWPFYLAMCRARAEGQLRVRCFGIGIDPLTLVADILIAAVFDAAAFDQLLTGAVSTNEEGRVVTADDGRGVSFSSPAIEEFLHDKPMQPAGSAVLALAWKHRDQLLSR